MPYSAPIKSMHITCILCCRFCRYCKATNSVQPQRFWVSYKHNGAYFTHSVTFYTFLWFLCLHALHTLNRDTFMCAVHFGFLLSAAQRCSCTTLTLTAQRSASAQRCSLQLFKTLTASHRCTPPLPPITGRT